MTRISFASWRDAWRAEEAAGREKEGEGRRTAEKKLTGRELWEKGLVGRGEEEDEDVGVELGKAVV